jgi:ankyrin repeat protein
MNLLEAIESDDASAVRAALKRVEDVNKPPTGILPPLSVAAVGGKLNAMRLLLDAGADPEAGGDYVNAYGKAAEAGQAQVLRMLLAKKKPQHLDRVVKDALRRRSIETLQVLRDAGADLTPAILRVAEHGYADIARWLIAQGCDVNARSKKDHNRTPLHLSAEHGTAAVAKVLVVEAGAEVDAKDEDGLTPLLIAAEHDLSAVSWSLRNRHAIEEAKREGRRYSAGDFGDLADFTVVDVLLDAGADPTAVDGDGNDALTIFRTHNQHVLEEDDKAFEYQEYPRQVEIERARARSILKRLEAAGASGGNPADLQLVLAARDGDVKGARNALAAGARTSARNPADDWRYSPLGYAALRDHGKIARMLIDAGADVEDGRQHKDKGSRPDSPLTIAANGGHIAIARMLLSAGADPNGGGSGYRPIIEAAKMGHKDYVRLLLDGGANVNATPPDDPRENVIVAAKRNLQNEKFNGTKKTVAEAEALIDYLISVGAKPPQPTRPFTAGVEFPNTFVELLVRASVKKVSAALASSINGTAHGEALNQRFVAGKLSFSVVRLDGSDWCSVLGCSGIKVVIDKAWERLAEELSAACKAEALLVCYEDTSACGAYRLYKSGKKLEHYDEGLPELAGEEGVPAEVAEGRFESARGKARTKPKDAMTALKSLARELRFRTINYGPGAQSGERFTFELLGEPRKIADAAYVTK